MRLVAIALLFGCTHEKPAVVAVPPPAASTVCYQGIAIGMGQKSRTIARRVVDPAAHQIREDVSRDDKAAHGAHSFHVVMDVDGDHFSMKEIGGAFAGSGTLTGEAWKWTAWSSTSEIPNTGITVDSDDELTAKGMKATKQIHKDGKVIATTTEELESFDCAAWDKFEAALATPLLDEAACERGCRNYATLKFWKAAGDRKPEDLAAKLEAGLPSCTEQCMSANNPAQTACFAAAKTIDDLDACN
jgi:hypothetical protein